MLRKLFAVLMLAWLASSGAYAADKPLVIESGQIKQLPAATALQLQAPTTANASINLPHGTAPTSPANGDCWTTTGGLYCRINGATIGPLSTGSGSVTSVVCGATTITGSGTCLGGSLTPQGRLTLTSGTPVLANDVTAVQTVYYDCHVGKYVPYYDGSNDQLDSISSCEISLTMQTSGTGVTNSGGVFDIWWVHSGANRICVATNGSGGGWASDTGGSNTARGTGYSQVHNTRGYWTNVNSITHCYNGTTDYGSISADQATYIGSLYTTAAGKTGMAFHPTAASGGTNTVLGLYNAYNRVRFYALDGESATSWNVTSTSWQTANGSSSNRINWVDGLAQSNPSVSLKASIVPAASQSCGVGVSEDSTSAAPFSYAGAFNNGTAPVIAVFDSFVPQAGLHYVQAMQVVTGGTCSIFANETSPTRTSWRFALEVEM